MLVTMRNVRKVQKFWLEIAQIDFNGVDNRGLEAPFLIRGLGDVRF